MFAGQCDIAVGNTYYVALMRTNDKEPEQKQCPVWAVRSFTPALGLF